MFRKKKKSVKYKGYLLTESKDKGVSISLNGVDLRDPETFLPSIQQAKQWVNASIRCRKRGEFTSDEKLLLTEPKDMCTGEKIRKNIKITKITQGSVRQVFKGSTLRQLVCIEQEFMAEDCVIYVDGYGNKFIPDAPPYQSFNMVQPQQEEEKQLPFGTEPLFKLTELDMYIKRISAIRDLVGILESDFSCFFDRCADGKNPRYFNATLEKLRNAKEEFIKAATYINIIKSL